MSPEFGYEQKQRRDAAYARNRETRLPIRNTPPANNEGSEGQQMIVKMGGKPPRLYLKSGGQWWHMDFQQNVSPDIRDEVIEHSNPVTFLDGANIVARDRVKVDIGRDISPVKAVEIESSPDTTISTTTGYFTPLSTYIQNYPVLSTNSMMGARFEVDTVKAGQSNTNYGAYAKADNLGASSKAFGIYAEGTVPADETGAFAGYFNGNLKLRGAGNGTGSETETPTDLASKQECHIYIDNNNFVIHSNHGGTDRYFYLQLDVASGSWTHDTSAP